MSAVVNVAKDDIPVTLYDTAGIGRAGLTVTATARRKGATVSASAVTDRGNGDYDLTMTFPSAGTWRVTATATIDGATAIDQTDIEVETAAQLDPVTALASAYGAAWANLDAAVSTRASAAALSPLSNLDAAISSRATVAAITAALSPSTITVTSPVAASGNVTVYQGDDQQAVDSRSLDWSVSNWPDLTGASVALVGQFEANPAVTLLATGSVTTPSGSGKTVRVELTHDQTDALRPGTWKIQVVATLASGHVATLVGGTDDDPVTLTVVRRLGA